MFRGKGIVFQLDYILMDPDTGLQSRHRLADEPMYTDAIVEATACVRALQELWPLFGRSAEYNAIMKLRAPDGRFDGIVLTEPILMTFGP